MRNRSCSSLPWRCADRDRAGDCEGRSRVPHNSSSSAPRGSSTDLRLNLTTAGGEESVVVTGVIIRVQPGDQREGVGKDAHRFGVPEAIVVVLLSPSPPAGRAYTSFLNSGRSVPRTVSWLLTGVSMIRTRVPSGNRRPDCPSGTMTPLCTTPCSSMTHPSLAPGTPAKRTHHPSLPPTRFRTRCRGGKCSPKGFLVIQGRDRQLSRLVRFAL